MDLSRALDVSRYLRLGELGGILDWVIPLGSFLSIKDLDNVCFLC